MSPDDGAELLTEKQENAIKDHLADFKKRYKYDSSAKTMVIDGVTYPVEIDPTGKKGFGIASVTHIAGTAKISRIKLGKKFFKLHPDKAKVILYHEIGHNIMERRIQSSSEEKIHKQAISAAEPHTSDALGDHSNSDEIVADAYSAAKVGSKKARRALQKVASMRSGVPEYKLRQMYDRVKDKISNMSFSDWKKQYEKDRSLFDSQTRGEDRKRHEALSDPKLHELYSALREIAATEDDENATVAAKRELDIEAEKAKRSAERDRAINGELNEVKDSVIQQLDTIKKSIEDNSEKHETDDNYRKLGKAVYEFKNYIDRLKDTLIAGFQTGKFSKQSVDDAMNLYDKLVKSLENINSIIQPNKLSIPSKTEFFSPIKEKMMESTIFDDSVLGILIEGTAFPNDELDAENMRRSLERKKRMLGQYLIEDDSD